MTHAIRAAIRPGLLSTAFMVTVTGCASPFDEAPFRSWRDHDPIEWQVTAQGTVHTRDTLDGSRSAPGGSVSENSATLDADAGVDAGADAYVWLALERNPSIRAAERQVERMGARVPQVTSLDDPMLQIAPLGEMTETAAGQVSLMTGVSQKLPFPGKLATRGRIAEQDVAMAVADLQRVRLRVIAETRRAYWSYYFTTHAIETTRESRKLLGQFRQIAETEYKAGTRSQTDVLRASVELSNLDNELITLDQRQATARSMLNQLMDRPIDAGLPAPKRTEPQRIAEDLEPLLKQAAASSPSIRKIHERIEQYRQRQKLARLNRWPDLTVSANYNAVDDKGMSMAANGKDQWWFGFGVNLPIWAEKYESAEREAMQGMLKGVADLTAERNRIAFQVQEAYLKVQAQQKLVELFDDVIIPQAQQTVDASLSGYRADTVNFLTLIDNWRKLMNFELMYHRALADMRQAAADLERAVGQDVPRTTHDVAPEQDKPPTPNMPNMRTESIGPEAKEVNR